MVISDDKYVFQFSCSAAADDFATVNILTDHTYPRRIFDILNNDFNSAYRYDDTLVYCDIGTDTVTLQYEVETIEC